MALSSHEKEGPWGCPYEEEYRDGTKEWTDGTYDDISSIVLRYGDLIHAIQVNYILRGAKQTYSIKAPRHGGEGGTEVTIDLNKENCVQKEYVTKITGTWGVINDKDGGNVISSLTVITNLGTYGPYGNKGGGYPFESSDGGKVVGFYGESGKYLKKIGIYKFYPGLLG